MSICYVFRKEEGVCFKPTAICDIQTTDKVVTVVAVI